MTDQATTTGETSRTAAGRRTRRQLLAGGTGALAAVLAAEALARPAPALAADGDNVVLGQDNTASATTVIANSADDKTQAAVPDPAGFKFTIHLNKAAPTRVRVAWFLVN